MSSHSTVVAIAALACVVALAGCEPRPSDRSSDSADVVRPEVGVVTLRSQAVVMTAELPGRVVASQTAEVRPQVSGIVQQRLFEEGSEVAEGASLYQIDPAPYKAAYDSAVAALQKAEATVPSAQAKAERYQGLVKQSAVSKQDFDDAVAALAHAKAEVATAKASVETARINLDYTTIKAPIGGRTDRSSLTPGALVTAGQTGLLTTIRTLDPIFVDVIQSSTNLLNLRQAIDSGRLKVSGSHVAVKLKLENGTIYPLAGKLGFSEANVSTSTGTVTLRAVFPNPQRLLLPGMYVRAIVEEGVAPDSFLVPQRAVTRNTKGEAIAMFLDQDGKAEERVLSVIRSVGNNWLIGAGVRDGDRVIVEGTQHVRPGQTATGAEVVVDDKTGEVLGRLPPQRRAARPGAEP
ncbi:efflux transporter periplasmic adaptor subunit [Rhodoplanes elegans]|uniref:Efflux transporter periplasmic adaptor subunit n=1 Tax=Rhodoplanes elegans TaxID=29408 RepID=A0A327L3E1_9BRAD|nr:efflux RND transporter periplasmic adaptor subunit [Rhodoplanes elegans]MBK5959272.1 efflux transporter periplasmic adaptor subunit [Rhodoplanes elegans]RAI42198.1 efflux transporter periplasmic adaptor subunit [Rhodoplanes elegans]